MGEEKSPRRLRDTNGTVNTAERAWRTGYVKKRDGIQKLKGVQPFWLQRKCQIPTPYWQKWQDGCWARYQIGSTHHAPLMGTNKQSTSILGPVSVRFRPKVKHELHWKTPEGQGGFSFHAFHCDPSERRPG